MEGPSAEAARDPLSAAFLQRELDALQGVGADPSLEARLRYELGELEEAEGDEPAAAANYLAASNLDLEKREPLAALARILFRTKKYTELARVATTLRERSSDPRAIAYAVMLEAVAHLAEDRNEDGKNALLALDDLEALTSSERALHAILLHLFALRTSDEQTADRALDLRFDADAKIEGSFDFELLLYRARTFLERGEASTALGVRALSRAIEIGPIRRPIRIAHDAHFRGRIDEADFSTLLDLAVRRSEVSGEPLSPYLRESASVRGIQVGEMSGESPAALFLQNLLAEDLARHVATLDALSRDPELRAATLALRATALLEAGEPEEALPLLEEATRLSRSADFALAMLGLAAWQMQDAVRVAGLVEEAAKRSKEPLLFVGAAYLYSCIAKDDDAAKASLADGVADGLPEQLAAEAARLFAWKSNNSAWHAEASLRLARANAVEAPAYVFEAIRGYVISGNDRGLSSAIEELSKVDEKAAKAVRFGLPSQKLNVEDSELGAGFEAYAAIAASSEIASSAKTVAALLGPKSGLASVLRARWSEIEDVLDSDAIVANMLALALTREGTSNEVYEVLHRLASSLDDDVKAARLYFVAGMHAWNREDLETFRVAFENAVMLEESLKPVFSSLMQVAAIRRPQFRARALELQGEIGGDDAKLAFARFALELSEGRPDVAISALSPLFENEALTPDLRQGLAVATLLNEKASGETLGKGLHALKRDTLERRAAFFGAAEARARGSDITDALVEAELANHPDDISYLLALSTRIKGKSADLVADAFDAIADRTDPIAEGSMRELATLFSLRQDASSFETAITTGSDPLPFFEAEILRLSPRERRDAVVAVGFRKLATGAVEDAEDAMALFQGSLDDFSADLTLLEGLRVCAERLDRTEILAEALFRLGNAVRSDARSADFFERAGTHFDSVGDAVRAEQAFERAFEKDPHRRAAFDRVFRKARDNRDGARVLELAAKRIDVADDPDELTRLFWERARVMRTNNDIQGAKDAIEELRMLDADHVGALALLGEILVREGSHREAAEHLERLALLESAPPKSRLTAGITAADLFENKLDEFDRGFNILRALEAATLTPLPVRERLARAAARSGAWEEAVVSLDVLMRERPDPTGRVDAARLSLAIQRDRLGNLEGSAPAVLRILEENPADAEGIDLILSESWATPGERQRLLARSHHALRSALVESVDLPTARRLARVAGAMGDLVTEELSVSLVVLLTRGAEGRSLLERVDREQRPTLAFRPEILPQLSQTLAAVQDHGHVAQFFRIAGGAFAEAFGPSRASLNLTKRDLLPNDAGLPIVDEIHTWQRSFGMSLDVYVGDVKEARAVGGERAALLVNPALRPPISGRALAALLSSLVSLDRGTAVLTGAEGFPTSLFVATCRVLGVETKMPSNASIPALEKAIGKVLSRKVKKALLDPCRAIAMLNEDLEVWSRSALVTELRWALAATTNFVSAFGSARTAIDEKDPRLSELVRFAFGGDLGRAREIAGWSPRE